MPALPEYDRLDGTGLAVLVRRGEVAPAELMDAAIERIEALNRGLKSRGAPRGTSLGAANRREPAFIVRTQR